MKKKAGGGAVNYGDKQIDQHKRMATGHAPNQPVKAKKGGAFKTGGSAKKDCK
jgi:hypothetical protein